VKLAATLVLAACVAEPSPTSVTVSGTTAPNVDVVFKSGAREEVAKAGADGKYTLALTVGTYRVFVRDDGVLSVGRMDRVRLGGLPLATAAGALDENLVPSITITRDTPGVDLATVRGGVVTGTVFDIDARPVMNAVISAHPIAPGGVPEPRPRPALGSDIAVTRYDGTFELRLPDGDYQLAASHAKYADASDIGGVDVRGGTRHVSLTLVRGCVITGKVVDASGRPVGEGALERKFGASDLEFVANGKIDPAGTFRWTTTDETEVVLRAWPWHRPPSASKRFNCRDGARHTTTFEIPDRAPDLSGSLVDKRGAPVPFTHLDIQPLDPGGIAQLELTNVGGHWAVFAMPPGRYMISAVARGGVAAKVVTVPSFTERLELSGTGRVEGTTTNLVTGTFELAFAACLDGQTLAIPRDPRLVPVANGRFVVDDVPACDLQFTVTWKNETMTMRTIVPNAGAGRVQLDLGAPREKRVTGTVRDRDGHRVAGAHVVALYKKQTATATTDADGKFEIATFAGATITADHDGARGEADVGRANVASERVELVLSRR
jgi:hypothetical protein